MSGSTNRLQKLESVRGLAAFYMLLHHYVHCNVQLAFFQQFFVFGQAAVMVFFILSGFVIYYSSAGRNSDFTVRDYLVRRFRRIYPPFLIVLFIEMVVQWIAPYQWEAFDWKNFVGNLLMLQDKQHPYAWFSPFFSNSPLWSLSYEWWFYMLFIPVWFLLKAHPDRRRYWAAGITFLGFGSFMLIPNQFSIIAAYFMMWWSGVELAREYLDTGKITFKRQAFSIVVLMLSVGLWAVVSYLDYRVTHKFMRSDYPYIQLQHQITVLLILIAGIAWYKLRFLGFDWTIGIFKYLSPVSYAMYILHLPLIVYAGTIALTGSAWLDMLWLFPLIYGISWLIEVPLQRKINGWIR